MKEPIVFFGSGPYVAPIIEVLRKNFDLKLIVTTEKNSADSVPSYAKKRSLPLLSVSSLSSSIGQLSTVNCQIAVLAYFGLILPKEVLDIFPKGIINTHPSLLPKYRGPTPGQTAILNGDTVTGTTIIKLDEEVDHGPILSQISEPILPTDTSETLYTRLFKLGAQILEEVLPKYISGNLKPTEQNHARATFTEELKRESGCVDVNKHPNPQQLDRMIRAYHPWPGAWLTTRIKNQELRIKLLPDNKLQVEGKRIMRLKDFINGYSEGKTVLQKLGLL